MDGADDLVRYGALDAALIGAFFMSYGIFGLVQLVNLFEGRPGRFAVSLIVAGALAQGFGALDVQAYCRDGPSAFVCNNDAAGLVALGMAWVWVSFGTLAMFAASKSLTRLAERKARQRSQAPGPAAPAPER